MRKIIFFDLDGTLWDRQERIPAGAVRAVRAARRNGHLVLINTGRTRGFVTNPALFQMGVDGMVSGCGTMLEWRGALPALHPDMDKNQVLHQYRLPAERIAALIPFLRARGFRILLEGVRCMYADMPEFADDPYMLSVQARMGSALRSLSDFAGRWEASKLTCDMARSRDPGAVLEELRAEWDIFVHDRPVCELVPRGFGKDEGLRRAAAFFGVPIQDTVAFGDGGNDTDMLRAAGIGVAMGNGTAAALAAADRVCPSLNEDGVYRALEDLGLST